MTNNILKIIFIFFFNLIFFNAHAAEDFDFNITEVQIIENGNKFIGLKRGTIISDNGIIIDADKFEYSKNSNILNASGEVKINDTINQYIIYSDDIVFEKNKNIIYTKNKSRGISLKDKVNISANEFEYNINQNLIVAKKNVNFVNDLEDYKIKAEFLSYLINDEKISTKGKTSALINTKYNFTSEDVIFLRKSMQLISEKNTTISDQSNLYKLSKFRYLINEEELRGEKIIINSNYALPESDTFYFSSGIINLKTKSFLAKDIKINLHKNIFDNSENDPRLQGLSLSKKDNLTVINKGVFTSCKKNDNCPPWSIEANEITHDKDKKQLNYKSAYLKLYDFPILYFPKFFHPDPTVKRQSGLLKPVINNSNLLGNSVIIPYFHVFSEESDLTFGPSIFDGKIKMIQNEFRKIGKNFNLIANFGHSRDYKSSTLKKEQNTSYLFADLDIDLNLENFETSKLDINFEKITNDTFLKIFNSNLNDAVTSLKPKNDDKLSSEIKVILEKDNGNLTAGFQSFENLQLKNNDRYQYILPYYNYNQNLFTNLEKGSVTFNSNGSNDLNETNKLKSQLINNFSFSSIDYISKNGFKNNFNINLKNLNSLGKNISDYKSSPQIEFSSIFELQTSFPLKKKTSNYFSYLTPKVSFRANPGDMKNHTSTKRTINNDNIFLINRLGLEDSFESGKSLTVGFDYKKETIEDMNKYFEFKLATVFRDKEENFMPSNTTLNKKTSNIFGSISNNFSKNLNFKYNFAADNNLDEIDYNDISTTISVNNFVSTFHYIKEIDDMGDQNFIKNNTSFEIDKNNYFKFNTRRNRKINLTEYYDLVYEYKNDCLTAGIKYKKTYYEDRDLKPSEDLIFTITLFPITTFEQKIDQ